MHGHSRITAAPRDVRTFIRLAAGTVLLAAVACSTPSAESDKVPAATGTSAGTLAEPNLTEIRSTIDAANQRAVTAMLAGDIAGSLASYADNAVSMMPGMPAMKGRAAIEQGMTGMMTAIKVTAATFTTDDVTVAGDLVIESGTYAMTMQPASGKPMDDKGKYITIWQRQADGTMKIVRDINNSDLSPGM